MRWLHATRSTSRPRPPIERVDRHGSRLSVGGQCKMLVNGKKFPLKKFYQFATHNGWREDADAIRETIWPDSERKKRTNTAMRRLEAVWFLEERGKLAEFKRRHWN